MPRPHVSRLWEATWGLCRERSALHPGSRMPPLGLGAGCVVRPQRLSHDDRAQLCLGQERPAVGLEVSQTWAKISHMVGIIWLGQGRQVSYLRPAGAHVVGISGRPLAQFENGRPPLRPPKGPRATIYVVC